MSHRESPSLLGEVVRAGSTALREKAGSSAAPPLRIDITLALDHITLGFGMTSRGNGEKVFPDD
jgi:hypothetical protein